MWGPALGDWAGGLGGDERCGARRRRSGAVADGGRGCAGVESTTAPSPPPPPGGRCRGMRQSGGGGARAATPSDRGTRIVTRGAWDKWSRLLTSAGGRAPQVRGAEVAERIGMGLGASGLCQGSHWGAPRPRVEDAPVKRGPCTYLRRPPRHPPSATPGAGMHWNGGGPRGG